MKTNSIIKWAALLLTVSGMASIPLKTMAAVLSVTAGQNVTESDKDYSGSYYALFMNGGTYNGTNIVLSTAANGVYTLTVVKGYGSLHGGTITSSGNIAHAVYAYGNDAANTLTVLDGTEVITTGNNSRGVFMQNGNTAILNNVNITTSGIRASGVVVEHGNGTTGTTSILMTGGTIKTSGTQAYGAYSGLTGNTFLSWTGVTVETTGEGADGIYAESGINGVFAVVIDNSSVTSAQSNGINIESANRNADIAIRNGSSLTGTSSLYIGSGSVSVSVEDSRLEGKVYNSGSLTMDVTEGSVVSGDIVSVNSSVSNVNFDNSSLTGISTVNDNATTHLTLNNSANWNMTGRSKVTTLHGANGGTITIDNVQGEDLIVTGGITGQTALNLTLSDGVKGQQEIWVVVDETDAMNTSTFILGREVSAGMYQYELVNETDGAWLVYTGTTSGTIPPVNPPVDPTDPTDPIIPPVVPPLPPPTAPIISSEGDAVLNTAAAVSAFWFTQLDSLHKRMGELRYNKPAGGDVLDNVWVRAYGQQINANTGITSVKGFSETQYGVDLGTDKAWSLDKNNTVYTGVFAGYGGADRDFHTSYEGSTDSGYGGLYGTWINTDGWYVDAVAKGQYFRSDFDGDDHGKYDSIGVGFSVEFGRQFEFKDGWFAEPSVQLSYLHLMNDNYTTRDGMSVDLTDADVLHIYGGARFGRNLKLNNGGLLQPYVKFGGLGQISSGNKVTVDGSQWRPNLDGARAVIGAGVVWQLDANSQLHLDYEASFGEKYDKPWGLNLGYRYQF